MVYAFDAATGKLQVGARGAQGRAVRRPPSQEHLRVGNAGHRWRAALRLFRQRRVVRLLARRQAAVERRDSIRSRCISTSAPPHRRSCTTAGCSSSTTTKASRSSPRWMRRPASSSGRWSATSRRRRARAGRRRSSGRHESAHRAHRHRPRSTRSRTRPTPARSCGACAGLTGQSTPTPGRGRRTALPRDRIAGRKQPAGVRGAPGRERRHLARQGRRVRTRSWRGSIRARPPTPRRRSSIAAGCMS